MPPSDARPSLKMRDPQIRAVVSAKGGVAARVADCDVTSSRTCCTYGAPV